LERPLRDGEVATAPKGWYVAGPRLRTTNGRSWRAFIMDRRRIESIIRENGHDGFKMVE
jgi:hypothetical protein